MSDYERIWLQPECCADWDTGRLWCQDPDPVDCDDGVPWTEYVRADIAANSERVTDASLTAELEQAAERERELVRALEWYEVWLKDINRRGKLGDTARATISRDAGAFALRALNQPHSREGGEE